MSDNETNDIEPTFDTLIESIKKFATHIKTLEERLGSQFGDIADFMEDIGKRIRNLEEKVFGEVQSSTATIHVTARRNRSTRRNRSCKH